MIAAFVAMLGLAMIIPLLPFYATKLGASGSAGPQHLAPDDVDGRLRREPRPFDDVESRISARVGICRPPLSAKRYSSFQLF